jgi:hypothetical protein
MRSRIGALNRSSAARRGLVGAWGARRPEPPEREAVDVRRAGAVVVRPEEAPGAVGLDGLDGLDRRVGAGRFARFLAMASIVTDRSACSGRL